MTKETINAKVARKQTDQAIENAIKSILSDIDKVSKDGHESIHVTMMRDEIFSNIVETRLEELGYRVEKDKWKNFMVRW